MHYYQFHIGDYKSHTHHLSLIEDLAYRRLLDYYYLHQSPIKQRDIARLIGMKDHEQDVMTVLNEFFVSSESGFINPRADKEIANFHNHQATSAYGAFIRDNPILKPLVDKNLFITHFHLNTHLEYIATLRLDVVQTMGTSSTHDATTNHKPITTNHKPIVKTTRGSRLSADWVLPKEWADWAKQERPDLNLQSVGEQFRDYWNAKAGSGSTKLDWQATWRNWVRNQRQEKPNFADIAKITVPSKKERDPVLVKLEQDRLNAVPMPDDIRANLAKLRGRQ
jgi:hypothetical protein